MALLDDLNNVINILVCNDDEPETSNMISYNENNLAFIGGDYVNGYFYPPKPYDSWIRDNGNWQAPIPYPIDDKNYKWNEDILNWEEIQVSE